MLKTVVYHVYKDSYLGKAKLLERMTDTWVFLQDKGNSFFSPGLMKHISLGSISQLFHP